MTKRDKEKLLLRASEVGRRDIVLDLLRAGVCPNCRGAGRRETPLMLAAREGHAAIVKLLVTFGADPEVVDVDGANALMWGARASGNRRVLQCLASSGVSVNNREDARGNTALMESALSGLLSNVITLISLGADPNIANKLGETPLSAAAAWHYGKVVLQLLDSGANPNKRLKNGGTPLMSAATARSVKMVEGMIAHGANADYANWEGNTALMLAIRCGNVRVVEILAARTKKINHSNHDGDTALSWAKEAGLKRLEPILIRHGARLLRRSKADPER